MSKSVKLKYVGKNGNIVEELCHDPLTCAKHAHLFRLQQRTQNFEAAADMDSELVFDGGLKKLEPALKYKAVKNWSDNFFKDTIDKLVADGGEVYEYEKTGVGDKDRSVRVFLRDEDFGGIFHIAFIDRDEKNLNSRSDSYGTFKRRADVHGWFVQDTIEGYANNEYGLNIAEDTPTTLNDLREAYTTCPVCGRNVGGANIVRVAFANRCCVDCAPELRQQLETPGWYN